jgi:hypothetical protein
MLPDILPANAMIANDFITAKDFHTYSVIILRQEKILRDHRAERHRRASRAAR